MHIYVLEREQWLPRQVGEIFDFFSEPGNLQVITPPWLDFRMVHTSERLEAGSLIRYRLRWRWVPIRWTTEISKWNRPHEFVDRAISSPYAFWHHEHRFEAREGGTMMRDFVTYALPLGWVGRIAYRAVVRRDVEGIFDFRAAAMRRLFPA